MNWWDRCVALFTPKNATPDTRDADRRFNAPYCPCGKSTVDMKHDYASYEGADIMVVHCDCGRTSRWFDTGFMGLRGIWSGFKEYQQKENRPK